MIYELIDWSVALLPVLLLLLVFVWLDVFKLMTLRETLSLLLLGGLTAILSYPVSGAFLDALPIGFSSYSRFVAPWIEEAIKAMVIVGLFAFNRIGFKLDAVISGFAVGAGFSVVENIIYLWRFPELAVSVWIVRGIGTAVMHGTTLAILAAIAHELAERETRGAAAEYEFRPFWFVPSYLIAVALHTVFNQFPDQPMLSMISTLLFAPFALMAVFHFGTKEAEQWLEEEREQHRATLEALQSGRFPDNASGRRIAALAARCDRQTAERIREYCEVQTWLVIRAEETLMEQAATADGRISVEAAAAFERLNAIRRRLGRSTFATLKALLPFSRNDYWEVSELRERLRSDRRQA